MCGTILRLFDGTRPIEWVTLGVEVLVLGVIALEIFFDSRRRGAEHRKRLTINERLVDVSKMMNKGQRIQSIVPDPYGTSDPPILKRWTESVEAWVKETNSSLAQYSSRAATAFLLITDAGSRDSVVYASGRQFILTGETRECYQKLVAHLENLKRIMEIPEAYFTE
jgi:hypothetical protein